MQAGTLCFWERTTGASFRPPWIQSGCTIGGQENRAIFLLTTCPRRIHSTSGLTLQRRRALWKLRFDPTQIISRLSIEQWSTICSLCSVLAMSSGSRRAGGAYEHRAPFSQHTGRACSESRSSVVLPLSLNIYAWCWCRDRHQVYHATTTVGFASQYMNEHSANNVLEHIREWSRHDPINGGQGEGVSDACLGADWSELPPKPKVQRLVRCA